MFKSKGFTIVELLIVIVVIAILAAISIVAYNGIQARAERSANASAIRAYRQALTAYKADTGTLPDIRLCLGPGEAYPGGTCTVGGQNGTVSGTWNTTLSPYGLSTQPPVKVSGSSTVVEFSPAFYGHPTLLWSIRTDQECDVPNIMSNNGGTWGLYGAAYSERNSTRTTCYMSLLNI